MLAGLILFAGYAALYTVFARVIDNPKQSELH